MNRIISILLLYILLLGTLEPTAVIADGAFFSNRARHLFEPNQKAILCWDGATETLMISSRVTGETVDDILRTAWVIPLVSSGKPAVSPGAIEAFWTLTDYLEEEIAWRPLVVGSSARVSVLESKKIDIYDITILEASDATELARWLTTNGFSVPDQSQSLFRECIEDGARYFIANKIDLENKYGPGFRKTRSLLDKLGQEKISGNELNTFLGNHRREVIINVLGGIPFEKSACTEEFGQLFALLDREKYENLLSTCKLDPEVYRKIMLLGDDLPRLLLGDDGIGESLREYFPDLKIVITPGRGRGLAYLKGKYIQLGLSEEFRGILEANHISVDEYKGFLGKHLPDISIKYKKIFEALNLETISLCKNVQRELSDLSIGISTPLKIEFTPPRPTYPLRISRVNSGTTQIEVLVCAPYEVMDLSGILRLDRTKSIPIRIRKKILPFLDLTGQTVLTRFQYYGDLSNLTKDAVFDKSTGDKVGEYSDRLGGRRESLWTNI
ncbi:MAG: DUF2330 domain-containing protein [Candidatus Ozemobacteraceae bacterium]